MIICYEEEENIFEHELEEVLDMRGIYIYIYIYINTFVETGKNSRLVWTIIHKNIPVDNKKPTYHVCVYIYIYNTFVETGRNSRLVWTIIHPKKKKVVFFPKVGGCQFFHDRLLKTRTVGVMVKTIRRWELWSKL